MQQLLESIIKAIVNNPDEVEVSEKESVDFPGLTILKIKVNTEDLGKVIGKRGRTINAIRDIITIAAIRKQVRVKVMVDEGDEDRGNRQDRHEDVPSEDMNVPETSEDLSSDVDLDKELGI